MHHVKSILFIFARSLHHQAGGPHKNLYSVLGASPKASAKELKEAFYEKSKKLHPDKQPDDGEAPERFRRLVAAYEVLGDPTKRKAYDASIGADNLRPAKSRRRRDEAPPRNIEIDLSEATMKVAWEAYKDRWRREEEKLRALEEEKIAFRVKLDHKRSILHHLSPEEQEFIKESMRLFRNPRHSRQFKSNSQSKGSSTGKEGSDNEDQTKASQTSAEEADDGKGASQELLDEVLRKSNEIRRDWEADMNRRKANQDHNNGISGQVKIVLPLVFVCLLMIFYDRFCNTDVSSESSYVYLRSLSEEKKK